MGGQTALAALALAWAEGRTGGSCAGVQGLPVLWRERALSPRVVRAGSGILRPAPRSGAFVPALRTEGPEHCLFLRIQMSLGPHPPVARMGRKSQRWLDICSRRRGGGAGTAGPAPPNASSSPARPSAQARSAAPALRALLAGCGRRPGLTHSASAAVAPLLSSARAKRLPVGRGWEGRYPPTPSKHPTPTWWSLRSLLPPFPLPAPGRGGSPSPSWAQLPGA